MKTNNDMKLFGQIPPDLVRDIAVLINRKLPSEWEKVISSKNSFVARRNRQPVIYYKEFMRRSSWERLKNAMRGDSRCERARTQSELIRSLGFASPQSIGWGVSQGREFMVSAGVDAEPIAAFLYHNWEMVIAKSWVAEKQLLLQDLGKEIARLHRAGIVHGDLRLNNILMRREAKCYRFYYLDNERNRRFPRLTRAQRVKNLIQLNLISPIVISPRDRLRFFSSYINSYPEFTSNQTGQLLAAVAAGTAERHRRKPELLRDFR
jgi:hypothetical protein